jgi:hypothetical protein
MTDANIDIVIDCADPEGNEFCVCPGIPLPSPSSQS